MDTALEANRNSVESLVAGSCIYYRKVSMVKTGAAGLLHIQHLTPSRSG